MSAPTKPQPDQPVDPDQPLDPDEDPEFGDGGEDDD